MTNKEFVVSKMPKARAESHRTNGPLGKTYWLIRNGRDSMWFSDGKTQADAWKNAAVKLRTQNDQL